MKDYLKSQCKEMLFVENFNPFQNVFLLARRTRAWELCGFRQDAAVQGAGWGRRGDGFLLL